MSVKIDTRDVILSYSDSKKLSSDVEDFEGKGIMMLNSTTNFFPCKVVCTSEYLRNFYSDHNYNDKHYQYNADNQCN